MIGSDRSPIAPGLKKSLRERRSDRSLQRSRKWQGAQIFFRERASEPLPPGARFGSGFGGALPRNYDLKEEQRSPQALEMQLSAPNGSKVILRGMSNGGSQDVSARRMEALFRHGDIAYAAECKVMTQKTLGNDKLQYRIDIQQVLDKHAPVFDDIPPRLPPKRGFEHTIELEKGAKPVITTPYRHPKKFKDEIKKTIQELLAMGHIRPSSSPFASLVVLVKKKDGTWRMCIDYRPMLHEAEAKRGRFLEAGTQKRHFPKI